MNKNGLLVEPQFDNPEYYLTSGERTKVTPAIQEFADAVQGETDIEIAKELLLRIHRNLMSSTRIIEKLKGLTKTEDKARKLLSLVKFKRSSDEILKSGYLSGCCDYSTLYTALARARGIPAMQVITILDQNAFQHPNLCNEGHYFTAVYLRDEDGKNGAWRIIDTVRGNRIDENICPLKLEDRNIVNLDGIKFYAIAYARDYSDIVVRDQGKERKIDCTNNMIRIQTEAFKKCDKSDIDYPEAKTISTAPTRSDDEDAR